MKPDISRSDLHSTIPWPDCYAPLMERLAALAQRDRTAIVAIDGRCGSGKTTLAQLIRRAFPCNIFHLDDFYLPPERREADWLDVPGGNMDFQRFLTEVLQPIRAGTAVSYAAYDCRSGLFRPAVDVPPRALNIVEGSYSHHPHLAAYYDLKVFLTCSPDEQRARLLARDPDRFPMFESRWIPLEERYFHTCGIERGDALTIDTSGFFPVPPQRSALP